MVCESPQLVFSFYGSAPGSSVDCGCCGGCIRVAHNLDRQRRLYWMNKGRFHNG